MGLRGKAEKSGGMDIEKHRIRLRQMLGQEPPGRAGSPAGCRLAEEGSEYPSL